MEAPKYGPNEWVGFDIANSRLKGFGKILGGYQSTKGWMYILNTGQENTIHVNQSDIKLRYSGSNWLSVDEPGFRVRA